MCPMFRTSGEKFPLVLLGSGPILVECQKKHFLEEESKSVYFPEEWVRDCIGESNRHLQWKVYNKGVCNMGSIIKLSGSNICP